MSTPASHAARNVAAEALHQHRQRLIARTATTSVRVPASLPTLAETPEEEKTSNTTTNNNDNNNSNNKTSTPPTSSLAAQKNRVTEAFAASAQLRESIRGTERSQAFQAGKAEGLDELRKAFTTRARSRHIGTQEARILEREAVGLFERIQAADAKAEAQGDTLRATEARYAEAQAELDQAVQVYLDASLDLLSSSTANTSRSSGEELSWKDYEILRLTAQVRELELNIRNKWSQARGSA